MTTKKRVLAGAAISALIGGPALTSAASGMEVPSSPAEQAATADLNHNIATGNAAIDDHQQLLQTQYQDQKKQNDALQQQYREQMKNYTAQDAQYQEQKKQNDLLQQHYQDELKGNQAKP